MNKLFFIVPTVALMLGGTGVVATELPTYEIMGFPLTPHQFAAVQSGYVRERSPAPALTLGNMPASPHQIAVLTPRASATAKTATVGLRLNSPRE
jgi:hypothetical protein